MAGFVIRRKLTALEASDLIDRAREFFMENRRRQVWRVGDDSGMPWFTVRRAHILNDIAAHSESGCPICGSLNVEATKEGLLFCYKCAVNKMIAAKAARCQNCDGTGTIMFTAGDGEADSMPCPVCRERQ